MTVTGDGIGVASLDGARACCPHISCSPRRVAHARSRRAARRGRHARRSAVRSGAVRAARRARRRTRGRVRLKLVAGAGATIDDARRRCPRRDGRRDQPEQVGMHAEARLDGAGLAGDDHRLKRAAVTQLFALHSSSPLTLDQLLRARLRRGLARAGERRLHDRQARSAGRARDARPQRHHGRHARRHDLVRRLARYADRERQARRDPRDGRARARRRRRCPGSTI